MRVGLVYQQWNHPTQPYLVETLRALRESGVELQVFARGNSNGSGEEDGVHLLRGPHGAKGAAFGIVQMISAPRDAWRFWRAVREDRYRKKFRAWVDLERLFRSQVDILHVQNSQLYPLLRPCFGAQTPRTIISFRGFDTVVRPLVDEQWRAELSELYERADALHFVSEYLRQEAILVGAQAKKCFVIRPGVNTKFFRMPERLSDASVLHLITTGRLVWEKALPLALLVVRELKRRGVPVRYHLAGDGPDKALVLHWVRRLGIGDQTELHGLVGQIELRELLVRCQIYYQPSVSEALGVGILEAQAMGLPVVATRVGGIAEAVLEGKTGLLFPFGDIEGLADAIQELWENSEKRKAMGAAARKWIEEHYSAEREAAEWLALYRHLCIE